MGNNATILVVDDVPENRALARAVLEDEGYRVSLATNGEEAIEAVRSHAPDCILMDIRMPKVDGVQAAQRIRALPQGKDAALIFVTAQRDVATFDRAVAAGGDDFITKPYRPDELLVRVQTAMRLRRLSAERSELVEQLKLQREHLQRLELQKEQLVAFLVHDFKNPVNAIDLQAQSLLRHSDDPERVRNGASRIKDESRTLLRLITNLLDISKGDEGSLAPSRKPIDANQLVQSAIDELSIRAASAGVKLEAEISAETIHADPDLMRRVLANLIDNAIRHSPEDSQITIRVTSELDGFEITVADQGKGVPVDQREAAFERFQSGENRSASNRGLGLAFCKIAVEAHGGRIWIEDAAPGAVFRLKVPLTRPAS
ncbi:MAG TPA: response regulator [Kofleriaceae bacterium]|nr:response regulator [Kofleriaceae bacterium]